MSSEIYELMKRTDEVEVVEKAHRRPRFVEDCVREMVRMAAGAYADLGPDAFISARQENLETIHQHNVVAERHGLVAELTRELEAGERGARHVTMREWLEGNADLQCPGRCSPDRRSGCTAPCPLQAVRPDCRCKP